MGLLYTAKLVSLHELIVEHAWGEGSRVDQLTEVMTMITIQL